MRLKPHLVLQLTLTLFISVLSINTTADDDLSMNVITFNIRMNTPNDGEHAWPYRKEKVASVIRFHQADIIGMQEALRGQIDDLQNLLPEYRWLGVGRNDGENDGNNGGEFSPIFYREDRFNVLDNGTFWLSETPDVIASKSWDAAITRIATWAVMEDQQTQRQFLLLNTHFDHRGEQARTNSAALITERVPELSGDRPVIITGDFNVPPTADAYKTMTGKFFDSYVKTTTDPHGPEGTFGGFVVGSSENDRRIDYVFVSENIEVLRYAALSDQWDGAYPSDHLPVMTELQLRQ
jgi:endonuclease/exonuclease/phosphatase family metal-dependent hydrolase